MRDTIEIRLLVTRADGAVPELLEETAQSLLREINEAQPGSASFVKNPAPAGSKTGFEMTTELVVGISGVASAWIVPTIQHWWSRQASDTGLVFKYGEFEVQVKGNAPPEVFAKVTQAIAQVTKG